MSSIIKVNEIQDGGGNTILSTDGSGTVTQTRTGIIEIDMWRLTSNLTLTGDTSTNITANLERCDTNNFGYIGTGMSESSGVFTFPKTGIYQVTAIGGLFGGLDTTFGRVAIHTTTDNSTYTEASKQNCSYKNGEHGQSINEIFFDVTNTTTHKVKFICRHQNSGTLRGDSDANRTTFKFIRLGDT